MSAVGGRGLRPQALRTEGLIERAARPRRVLICKSCGRRIEASEVKYRTTEDGKSLLICPDCAKKRGI